jgi:hypothetical protein
MTIEFRAPASHTEHPTPLISMQLYALLLVPARMLLMLPDAGEHPPQASISAPVDFPIAESRIASISFAP